MGRRVEKKQETQSVGWERGEKDFQRRDPLVMKGNKTRFGRKNGHISDREEVGRKLLKMKMTGEFYLTV